MARSKGTVRIPREVRELMGRYPEANWPAIFRESGPRSDRLREAAKGTLEEADDPRVIALTERFKRGAGARFRRTVQRARR